MKLTRIKCIFNRAHYTVRRAHARTRAFVNAARMHPARCNWDIHHNRIHFCFIYEANSFLSCYRHKCHVQSALVGMAGQNCYVNKWNRNRMVLFWHSLRSLLCTWVGSGHMGRDERVVAVFCSHAGHKRRHVLHFHSFRSVPNDVDLHHFAYS